MQFSLQFAKDFLHQSSLYMVPQLNVNQIIILFLYTFIRIVIMWFT